MNYRNLALSLGATLAAGIAMPATAQPFNGPYVGAQTGWVQNKIGTLETSVGRPQVDHSRDAVTTGIFAGYNLQPTSNIVLSAEAAVNFGIDDSVAGTQKDATATINPEYGFDLGIRAGYLVTPNTLVYGRGGYENVRTSIDLRDINGSRYDKDNFDGWTVGGGVERAITDRISARLEYRYSDLGGGDSKFEQHQVLAGVAWHF